jgi:hypothetical protein
MDSESRDFGMKYGSFSKNISTLVRIHSDMKLLCQKYNECHVMFPSSLSRASLIRRLMDTDFEIVINLGVYSCANSRLFSHNTIIRLQRMKTEKYQ